MAGTCNIKQFAHIWIKLSLHHLVPLLDYVPLLNYVPLLDYAAGI